MKALVKTLAVVVAAALLSTLTLVPAHAGGKHGKNHHLGLSRHGKHWKSSLSRPVFPVRHRWVPGDTIRRTLLIRNRSDNRATLTLRLRTKGSHRLFGPGRVSLRAKAHGRHFKVTRSGRHRLLRLHHVAPHEKLAVRLVLKLPKGSKNISQRARTRLPIRITLTQRIRSHGVIKVKGEHLFADRDDLILASSGQPLAPYPLLLAMLLLGSGFALISASRKETDDVDSHA